MAHQLLVLHTFLWGKSQTKYHYARNIPKLCWDQMRHCHLNYIGPLNSMGYIHSVFSSPVPVSPGKVSLGTKVLEFPGALEAQVDRFRPGVSCTPMYLCTCTPVPLRKNVFCLQLLSHKLVVVLFCWVSINLILEHNVHIYRFLQRGLHVTQ